MFGAQAPASLCLWFRSQCALRRLSWRQPLAPNTPQVPCGLPWLALVEIGDVRVLVPHRYTPPVRQLRHA